MFLALVLALTAGLSLTRARAPSGGETFRHRDPATGLMLACDRCPPGRYLRAPCTATQQSDCARCPPGSFTALWNHIGKCLRCGTCDYNWVVTRECAAEHDRECECKEGHYYRRNYDMCLEHGECPSGHGVLSKGTAHQDTVCQVCPPGYFSDRSSARHTCSAHTSCEAPGQRLVLKGSTWHDSVCATCAELRTRDGADIFREILPLFVEHHQMPVKRLRRLLRILAGRGQPRGNIAGLQRGELHVRVVDWVRGASIEELREIPESLKNIGAPWAAEKLQTKLTHIDQQLSQSCVMDSVMLAE